MAEKPNSNDPEQKAPAVEASRPRKKPALYMGNFKMKNLVPGFRGISAVKRDAAEDDAAAEIVLEAPRPGEFTITEPADDGSIQIIEAGDQFSKSWKPGSTEEAVEIDYPMALDEYLQHVGLDPDVLGPNNRSLNRSVQRLNDRLKTFEQRSPTTGAQERGRGGKLP